jgi:Tol biopolymer transport system component
MSIAAPPLPVAPPVPEDPDALIEEARRHARRRRRRNGAAAVALGAGALAALGLWGGGRIAAGRDAGGGPSAAAAAKVAVRRSLGATVAFTAWSKRTGAQQVFVIRPDGSVTQVTRGRFDTGLEAWSPDGRRLAVDRDTPSGQGELRQTLYIVAANGSSQPMRLTHGDWAGNVQWSPTGGRIAFDGDRRIEVADVSGGRPRTIGVLRGWMGTGARAWSPDGTRIAFVGEAPGQVSLLETADADGSHVVVLARSDPSTCRAVSGPPGGPMCQMFDEPAWSPDGARIAAVRWTPDARSRLVRELVVMGSNGPAGGFTLRRAGATAPVWSPDGARISFVARQGLFVMDADGTHVRRLTPFQPANVSWAPDGSRLAFTGRCGVYVVNADGSAPTRLANTDRPYVLRCRPVADEIGPVWQPVLAG